MLFIYTFLKLIKLNSSRRIISACSSFLNSGPIKSQLNIPIFKLDLHHFWVAGSSTPSQEAQGLEKFEKDLLSTTPSISQYKV